MVPSAAQVTADQRKHRGVARHGGRIIGFDCVVLSTAVFVAARGVAGREECACDRGVVVIVVVIVVVCLWLWLWL